TACRGTPSPSPDIGSARRPGEPLGVGSALAALPCSNTPLCSSTTDPPPGAARRPGSQCWYVFIPSTKRPAELYSPQRAASPIHAHRVWYADMCSRGLAHNPRELSKPIVELSECGVNLQTRRGHPHAVLGRRGGRHPADEVHDWGMRP